MDTRTVQKQKGELQVPTDPPTENRQINFIDFNKLKGRADRKPTETPTLLTRIEKEKKKPKTKDPRVRAFIEWFSIKFQHRFGREYQITNWAQVGKQVKQLSSFSLSWTEGKMRKHLCSRCHERPPTSGGYCRPCANKWMRENRRGRWGPIGVYRNIRKGDRTFRESRLFMEEHLGRKIERLEYVHHENGDINDNRIENLKVVSPAEHYTIHHRVT